MKNLLILFLLLPLFVSAQEYRDTIFVEKTNGQFFINHYRIHPDLRLEGLISGSFRVASDSLTALNYVVAQRLQTTNELWYRETQRINSATYLAKLVEFDTVASRSFRTLSARVVRELAKPELLTYRVDSLSDTTFVWSWRFLKTGASGVNARIVEMFSDKVLRIIIDPVTTPLTLTADGDKVLRFTYEGSARYFFRNPDNINEWICYGPNKSTLYRLVRRKNSRAR